MSIRIHDRVSTEDRASLAALHRLTQKVIEARQHDVILVKNMNPTTSGTLNALIPIIGQTSVLRFGMNVTRPAPNRRVTSEAVLSFEQSSTTSICICSGPGSCCKTL